MSDDIKSSKPTASESNKKAARPGLESNDIPQHVREMMDAIAFQIMEETLVSHSSEQQSRQMTIVAVRDDLPESARLIAMLRTMLAGGESDENLDEATKLRMQVVNHKENS